MKWLLLCVCLIASTARAVPDDPAEAHTPQTSPNTPTEGPSSGEAQTPKEEPKTRSPSVAAKEVTTPPAIQKPPVSSPSRPSPASATTPHVLNDAHDYVLFFQRWRDHSIKRARHLKHVGIAKVAVGGALFIAGGAVLAKGLTGPGGPIAGFTAVGTPSFVEAIVGLVFTVVGVCTWPVGAADLVNGLHGLRNAAAVTPMNARFDAYLVTSPLIRF